MIIIGIDTGGTFTDFIYRDKDKWGVYKCLSTPSNPAEAVLNGIKNIAKGKKVKVVHGSTVATNALLEKKGAKTALITNKGFEDILEIGRQNRGELYNFAFQKNPSIVPESLRLGVRCRVDRKGNVLTDLNESDVKDALKEIEAAKVESVAVSFLFSFVDPFHEKRVKELFSKLHIPVSLSHEILSEFREFERTSTVVINAYVLPKMQNYLGSITESIGMGKMRVMQSNGGSITVGTAQKEPVRTILSGPAGGVVGAYEIGRLSGYNKLITFDMGGTSTDVALIDDKLPLTFESHISGFPIKAPMIDIHTVGAGGGSVAFIDTGGSLKVGPESAGAVPGPICYGYGKEITVTDANLFLGRLVPENFLGGKMDLKAGRIRSYFDKMSKKAGITPFELAEGILSVANTSMERAIRVVSVERGYDPSEFTLFSFGGAGGMHSMFLARLLNIPKVFIPKDPGILSAMGMVMADIVKDYSHTVMIDKPYAGEDEISKLFEPLEERGFNDLGVEGVKKSDMLLERYLDMRYQGQSYEILVPFTKKYTKEFHGLHEKYYGYSNKDNAVQIVNLRLRAKGFTEKPIFTKQKRSGTRQDNQAVLGEKDVVFDGKIFKSIVVSRDKLKNGNVVKGPALIVEYSSTTVIPPFATGKVDGYGNIVCDVKC